MKQGVVLVLTASVLFAAVAAAHFAAPLPDGRPFQASAKAATASGPASSMPRPVGDMSASRPLVEVRQAPVPLQMRERPAVVLSPTVDAAASPVPATAPSSDVEGGTFAKSAIEADGYRSVKNIVAGPGGTWQARALRGTTEVVLRVHQDGRVSAD